MQPVQPVLDRDGVQRHRASATRSIISPGTTARSRRLSRLSANTYAHGVQGQPAPQIHFAPALLLSDSGNGSRLSYVRLEGSNVEPLDVDNNSEADQVYVHASAFNACIVYGTLIDSVCWTSRH